MKRRIFSAILALVLVAALSATAAFADDGTYKYDFSAKTVTDTDGNAISAEELATVNGVNLHGIAQFNDVIFPTMKDAYDAVSKYLTENGGLEQDGLTDDEFNAIYTDKVTGEHDGVALTWTIFGTVDWGADLPKYFITGGRAAAWYGSDEKTIREITVVGHGDNAVINYGSNPTMSYQWWGGSTDSYQSFAFDNLTLNSTVDNISISANFRTSFDLSITGCTINGKVYHYFNGQGNVTVTETEFTGSDIENAYAFMVQGHETEPLTINFSDNVVSGYDRGINIDQATANVTIANNEITPGVGYSAVQLSGFKTAEITGNTVHNQGNFLTFHNNLAKNNSVADGRTLNISDNDILAVDGVQGYLFYDDIAASGEYDSGTEFFELTWADDNTVDESIITTSGIKGEIVYKSEGFIDNAFNPTAKIGDTTYPTLSAAAAAVKSGETIVILKDTSETLPVPSVSGVTYTALEGVEVSGGMSGNVVGELKISGITFTVEDVYLRGKADSLVTVEDCEFKDITVPSGKMGAFNLNAASGNDAGSLVFTGNSITGTRDCTGSDESVNIYTQHVQDATITGNYFGQVSGTGVNLNLNHGKIDVSGNTIENWAAADGDEAAGRAMRIDVAADSGADVKINENKLVNSKATHESYVKLSGVGSSDVDVSNNYWNGKAPDDATPDGKTVLEIVGDATSVTGDDVYYEGPNMRPEDLNTYDPHIPDMYEITVTQPAGGSVSASLSNSSAGATITVTATPDAGYELVYITVDGEPIEGDTFTMPDKAVTVSAVFVPATGGFADVVPGAWYVDAVNYVVANGLMEGTSATTFEPEAQMTRAMFWTILARIDGETITGATWADDARAWAVANNVSDGTNPHAPLTREQLVTMLWRYLGEPATTGTLAAYTDANAVSAWAKTPMAWAVNEGVITGVTATTLAPQSTATRAQCATILMRNAF